MCGEHFTRSAFQLPRLPEENLGLRVNDLGRRGNGKAHRPHSRAKAHWPHSRAALLGRVAAWEPGVKWGAQEPQSSSGYAECAAGLY